MDKNFLLVFIIITHCSTSNTQNDECTSKNVTQQCLKLKDCPELLQKYMPLVFPMSKEIRSVLKEAHCGFEGKLPKVCCPLKEATPTFNIITSGYIKDEAEQSNSSKDLIKPSSWSTLENGSCNSAGSPLKKCIMLKDCTELLQKHLPLVFPLSDPVISILKEAHCGFEGRVPKVCCLMKEQPNHFGTATPRIKSDEKEKLHGQDVNKPYPQNSWNITNQSTMIQNQDTTNPNDQWGIPNQSTSISNQNSDYNSHELSATSEKPNLPATFLDRWGDPEKPTPVKNQDPDGKSQGTSANFGKPNNPATSLDQWGIPENSIPIKNQNSDDKSQGASGTSEPKPNHPPTILDKWGTPNQYSDDKNEAYPTSSRPQLTLSSVVKTADRLAAERQNLPDVTSHANYRFLPADCGQISDGPLGPSSSDVYKHPWMALIAHNIQGKISYACIGTVIHKFYIMTAASCIVELGSGVTVAGVRIGEYDIAKDQACDKDNNKCVQDFGIEGYNIHPDYNKDTKQNDIGLIRVTRPIDLTRDNSRPICLPVSQRQRSMELDGNTMISAGWPNEFGKKVRKLEKKSYYMVSNERCMELTKGKEILIGDKQACGLMFPCTSNTGEPLIMTSNVGSKTLHFQHGIVSYSPKNCTLSVSSVFTKVANYLPWILDIIEF